MPEFIRDSTLFPNKFGLPGKIIGKLNSPACAQKVSFANGGFKSVSSTVV